MKKFATILIALVFIGMLPFSASAQMKMAAGIKAGLNIASLSGSDVSSDAKSKMGLAALGFFGLQFSDMLGGQVEAGYVMDGAKASSGDASETYSYLEIPILLKCVLPVPAVNPFIYVGPSIGILLSATAKASDGTSTDMKDFMNSTDFGLAFGAGIDLPMGLLLDLRYTLGLSKIMKEETVPILGTITPDIKNGAFAIMVGWEFKL